MEQATETTPNLYEHAKRPEWGLAILAWDGGDRRRYQFEDGQMRTFKRGYYRLMSPVDRPMDATLDVLRTLKSLLRSAEVTTARTQSASAGRSRITLDEQIAHFRGSYPEGFTGDAYLKSMRGVPQGKKKLKRLKRHRNPAVAQAREILSKDALDAWVEAHDWEGIRDAMVKVLTATDLVASADVRKLRKAVTQIGLENLGTALRDLLYGEGDYDARFDAYITALRTATGSRPSWSMATSIPALVFPEEHIPVKARAFEQQARWMAPTLRFRDAPSASLYNRLLSMATSVRDALNDAGVPPADLLDVRDFICETLRPAARKEIEAMRTKAPAAVPAATEKADKAAPTETSTETAKEATG